MEYIVIGTRNVNYVSKKTNKPVIGVNVYMTTPLTEEGSVGDMTEEAFFRYEALNGYFPQVGDVVTLSYQKRGNYVSLVGITKIS